MAGVDYLAKKVRRRGSNDKTCRQSSNKSSEGDSNKVPLIQNVEQGNTYQYLSAAALSFSSETLAGMHTTFAVVGCTR